MTTFPKDAAARHRTNAARQDGRSKATSATPDAERLGPGATAHTTADERKSAPTRTFAPAGETAYTAKQLSEQFNVSHSVLTRLVKAGIIVPTLEEYLPNRFRRLYSKADVSKATTAAIQGDVAKRRALARYVGQRRAVTSNGSGQMSGQRCFCGKVALYNVNGRGRCATHKG